MLFLISLELKKSKFLREEKGEHLHFEKRPNPPAPFPQREGGERLKFPPLKSNKKISLFSLSRKEIHSLYLPLLLGEGWGGVERAGERSDWFLGQIEMLPEKVMRVEKNPPSFRILMGYFLLAFLPAFLRSLLQSENTGIVNHLHSNQKPV